jgi:hypothetical protein
MFIPYYRNPDSHWEYRLLGLAAIPRSEWGVVLLIVIVAGLAFAALLEATLTELYRIYRAHTKGPSRIARLLWAGLGGYCLICCLAIVLLLDTATFAIGCYLISWGFLLFVGGVKAIDWHASKQQPIPPNTGISELDLKAVLQPWAFPRQQTTEEAHGISKP